ncbi:hypothetical protein, partial [Nocardioides deserti]
PPAPKVVTRTRGRSATRPAGPPAGAASGATGGAPGHDGSADGVPATDGTESAEDADAASVEHVPVKKKGPRKR